MNLVEAFIEFECICQKKEKQTKAEQWETVKFHDYQAVALEHKKRLSKQIASMIVCECCECRKRYAEKEKCHQHKHAKKYLEKNEKYTQ